jgi:hypothetical protein
LPLRFCCAASAQFPVYVKSHAHSGNCGLNAVNGRIHEEIIWQRADIGPRDTLPRVL